MKELMCTHLAKRGSTYYFRRKTPVELVHKFGKEIMKSLGTKDRKEAEILVRKMGSFYDELFAQALTNAPQRDEITAPSHTPDSQEIIRPRFDAGLTIDDAHVYAARFLRKLRASREKAHSNNTFRMHQAALNNLEADAKEFLRTGVHPFDEHPEPMWKHEAKLQAVKALRKNKDLRFMELEPHSSTQSSKVGKTSSQSHSTPSLNEVLTKWAAERKPQPRTVAIAKRIVSRFEEIVSAIPIGAITKQNVVAFKDGLLADGSSPANVNQYLTILNTLLNFAVNEAAIEVNPAQGVSIREQKAAKAKRLPFDLTSLNRIFGSAIYQNSERPVGGKGEAAYWLPLIALYSGARLNEICQLNTRDISVASYQDSQDMAKEAWVFSLTDEGEGQSLKNAGSRRLVPVHQELIKLGFIEYVQALPQGRVFPQLTPAKAYGSVSANWSKWFNKYLREQMGVTDRRMVFHSFRHSFKDYARNAGIPTEVHHAITGHSSGNVGDNYGGETYPLRPLVEAMEAYRVTGLVLPSKVGS